MNADSFLPPGAECPSDYTFDLLRAGLLETAPEQAARDHMATCQRCTEWFAYVEAGFATEPEVDARKILAGARRLAAQEQKTTKPWWQRFEIWLPTLVGAAAGIFFLVSTPKPPPVGAPDAGEATRSKGALGLHVDRATAAGSVEQISGSKFAPGDRIRFRVSLPWSGLVNVIGVEAGGAVYKAWPLEAGLSARQEKTEKDAGRVLPGAFQLDDSQGREVLYLVLCPDAAGTPQCHAEATVLKCQPDCISTPFVMEKRR